LGGEGFEGCVERGAEQVLFAVGKAVETLPEEIEVDARGGIALTRTIVPYSDESAVVGERAHVEL